MTKRAKVPALDESACPVCGQKAARSTPVWARWVGGVVFGLLLLLGLGLAGGVVVALWRYVLA